MGTKGFFVDWNGKTRRTDQPGEPYRCVVNTDKGHVDVIDSGGQVIFEADYFPTLDAVEAAGVDINLI